jgi:hypothetical protein
VLLALLAGIVLAGAYWWLMPRLDSVLADALRREYILPPSSTVVVTRGSLLDTLEGQVRRVHIASEEAKLDSIVVEDLELYAEGLQFDLVNTLINGRAALSEVAHGELSLKVSEDALKEHWESELRSKGLSDVNVELAEDGAEISGIADMKLAQVRIGAKGRFSADGGQRITFSVDDLELGGLEVGVEELKQAFASLAPVVDVGRFRMDAVASEPRLEDGYLVVTARTRSIREKIAEDEMRRQTEESTQSQERLKIPTIDELKDVFTEMPGEGEGGQEAQDEKTTE